MNFGDHSKQILKREVHQMPSDASNHPEVNMFNDEFVNMLQQSRFLNESHIDQNNSSVMNLSELIVSNNPALQNILNMAA